MPPPTLKPTCNWYLSNIIGFSNNYLRIFDYLFNVLILFLLYFKFICLNWFHFLFCDRNEDLDVNNSLSHALAEASKLTYVCGQWVDTCEEWSRQTQLGYRIVAPTLPANGDYSAYNEWGLYLK